MDPCRFSVTHAYNSELNTFYKTIPSRFYSEEERTWSFPISVYSIVADGIRTRMPGVSIGVLSKSLVQYLQADSPRHCTAAVKLHLPDFLEDTLLPFQRDGVRFVVQREGRALIADEMGCGKTLTAIGVAAHFRSSWPLLVVAPASVKGVWIDKIFVSCFCCCCF